MAEFESIEQYSRLRVKRVVDIRYPFEQDEDMIRVRSSVKELVLVSSVLLGNIVRETELKDGTENNCAAAKIVLENGQILFIDPGFPYGIGIGGKEQEEYWQFNGFRIEDKGRTQLVNHKASAANKNEG